METYSCFVLYVNVPFHGLLTFKGYFGNAERWLLPDFDLRPGY